MKRHRELSRAADSLLLLFMSRASVFLVAAVEEGDLMTSVSLMQRGAEELKLAPITPNLFLFPALVL